MAQLINADPKEIVFTSGATESNNISVKGVARFYYDKKKHIITSQTVGFLFVVPSKIYFESYWELPDPMLSVHDAGLWLADLE